MLLTSCGSPSVCKDPWVITLMHSWGLNRCAALLYTAWILLNMAEFGMQHFWETHIRDQCWPHQITHGCIFTLIGAEVGLLTACLHQEQLMAMISLLWKNFCWKLCRKGQNQNDDVQQNQKEAYKATVCVCLCVLTFPHCLHLPSCLRLWTQWCLSMFCY